MTNNSAVRSRPRDADPLLIGLDIGTSAVRATAFTLRGAPVASGMAPLAVSRPTAGRVEQDARSWSSQAEAALACMAAELGPAVSRVRAVGLTGQCPSFTLLSAQRDSAGARHPLRGQQGDRRSGASGDDTRP